MSYNGYVTEKDAKEAQEFAVASLRDARDRFASGQRNENVDYEMLAKLSDREVKTEYGIIRSQITSETADPETLTDYQDMFAALEAEMQKRNLAIK